MFYFHGNHNYKGEVKIKIENIIPIILAIIPCIITGIITFLITKYNYHRNRPLDKYELVYNRVYYPIYVLLMSLKNQNTQINYEDIIIDCKPRIEKYRKYVDRATLLAFEDFRYSIIHQKDEKQTYQKFKTNILDNNVKLRLALGYPEPGFIGMYRFTNKKERYMVNCVFILLFIVLVVLVTSQIYKFNSFLPVIVELVCALLIWVIQRCYEKSNHFIKK